MARHPEPLEELSRRIGELSPERRRLLALRLRRLRSESPGAGGAEGRLVAYVETADGGADDGALRRFLLDRLPEPMIPSRIVCLEELPTLPSGKVNRRELQRRPIAPAHRPHDPAAPRTRTERLLTQIWQELLGVERVTVQDHFFELGGHSLLATRLVSRLHQALGLEVGLRTVFENPTLAALADAIEAQAGAGGEPAAAAAITPVPREGQLELSYAQERLRFLDQLEPDNPAYNIAAAVRLSGELDTEAFRRAVREIVRRHEALRTVFPVVEGKPVPEVREELELEIPETTLEALPPAEARERFARLAVERARQPFDLSRGPLLRAELLRLGPREHGLTLTLHHIVADGWSLGVLLEELSALYTAFRDGAASPLPELPIQYLDYAAWQRRWLEGPRLEGLLEAWRRRLEGAQTVLELPTDRPRPATQSFRGGALFFVLPRSLGDRLHRFSRSQGATLFMTLLAGFEALMARYSGQRQVLVGSPVANRSLPEVEGLIGFFVNTLVLPGEVGDDPSFRGFVARLRQVTLEAYKHQELPFEKLVEELAPERDPSRNPLFQVMFALQNTPMPAFDLGGLTLEQVDLDTGRSMFDLSLEVVEETHGLGCRLEFSSDLFDRATVERLRRHYQRLLESALEDPEQRLSNLALLAAAERQQILGEWSGGGELGPTAGTLVAGFEAQAARRPEAVALVGRSGHLSYGELDRGSNRLARHLRRLGIGPEVRVGVLMERTPELILAILGVLKAGGAYVPLDPAYPPQRLSYLFEDSGAALLITAGDLAERLGEGKAEVLLLDRGWGAIAGQSEEPLDGGEPAPGHLAYLIYTSGSTGAPKGVAIEHRSAAALVAWSQEVFSPRELAGMLASTSVCFDLSVFELFATLCRGGTVILVDNVLELAEAADASRVTLINSVPSAVTELLRLGALPESVETVALAGEVLGASLAESLYRQPRVRRLLNLYGPSEDTTYSTFAEGERRDPGAPGIGRAIAGTAAYVVDGCFRPVPVGVAGEVLLAGAGLARGYLGRPARTAAAFLPDPFGQRAGGRVYATGDLARLLPDGSLDFLGRRDHQVKVRGFRIELPEVEAALASHPRVLETVVVVHRAPATGDRLVAYVVGSGPEPPAAGELRDFLSQRLPAPMVPSLFLALEALPRTPNGKVDRRALQEPDASQLAVGQEMVAPRNPTEQTLARLWMEMLGLREVGIHHSFFELGGHSLMAGQLVARIHEALGVELPVRALFERTTIATQAEEIERRRGQGETAAGGPIKIERREEKGSLEDLLAELTGPPGGKGPPKG